MLDPIETYVESPVEQMMLDALLSAEFGLFGLPRLVHGRSVPLGSGTGIELCPQFPIGRYRADFALFASSGDIRVAIECDGHEFHERTREQAAADKRRDREMQALGWMVLRFTGSEIFADAAACAREVARCVVGGIDEFTPVGAPAGEIARAALVRAVVRSARPRKVHKSKRRLWGLYARWRDNPSIINEAALSDAYLRHAALAAKASLGE